jgi:hypothetical protein
MVPLLSYAYPRGQRSSRRVEQACVKDIAFRVINAKGARIPRGRVSPAHEHAIAGLVSDVLRLCADAGLAGVGLSPVDGTKVHADASHHANRDYEQIAREILAEADADDTEEIDRFGEPTLISRALEGSSRATDSVKPRKGLVFASPVTDQPTAISKELPTIQSIDFHPCPSSTAPLIWTRVCQVSSVDPLLVCLAGCAVGARVGRRRARPRRSGQSNIGRAYPVGYVRMLS